MSTLGQGGIDATFNWEPATAGIIGYCATFGATEGGATLVTLAANNFLGILQNDPAQNEQARIRVSGVTKAVAGGTISAGAHCIMSTSGNVVAATTESTENVIGVAWAAASSGHEFELEIRKVVNTNF